MQESSGMKFFFQDEEGKQIFTDGIVSNIIRKYNFNMPSAKLIEHIGFYCASHRDQYLPLEEMVKELEYLKLIRFFRKGNGKQIDIKNNIGTNKATAKDKDLISHIQQSIEQKYWEQFQSVIKGWYIHDKHYGTKRSRVPDDFPKLPTEHNEPLKINDAFIQERIRVVEYQKRMFNKAKLTQKQYIGKIAGYFLNLFEATDFFRISIDNDVLTMIHKLSNEGIFFSGDMCRYKEQWQQDLISQARKLMVEKNLLRNKPDEVDKSKKLAFIYDLLDAFHYAEVEASDLDLYDEEEYYKPKYDFIRNRINGYESKEAERHNISKYFK